MRPLFLLCCGKKQLFLQESGLARKKVGLNNLQEKSIFVLEKKDVCAADVTALQRTEKGVR